MTLMRSLYIKSTTYSDIECFQRGVVQVGCKNKFVELSVSTGDITEVVEVFGHVQSQITILAVQASSFPLCGELCTEVHQGGVLDLLSFRYFSHKTWHCCVKAVTCDRQQIIRIQSDPRTLSASLHMLGASPWAYGHMVLAHHYSAGPIFNTFTVVDFCLLTGLPRSHRLKSIRGETHPMTIALSCF